MYWETDGEYLNWDVTLSPDTARYINFNGDIEVVPDKYLNAYAFRVEAEECLESNSNSFPVDLYIPSCCCKKCNHWLKKTTVEVELTQIHSLMSVKDLLDAIYKEYSQRYINNDELCGNDDFIKDVISLNKNNCKIAFNSILNGFHFFSNIVSVRDGYQLFLKKPYD